MHANEIGELFLMAVILVGYLLFAALFVGAVVAVWILILGKFHRPPICAKCGADLREAHLPRQPFSD